MTSHRISIITVCYNAVDTIEKTILSVISQTYSDVEYIVVDGSSTDGTTDVIKKYAGNIAKWISEPDMGIYDAMNKGVKYATGEWLFFLNSDDVFYNEKVLQRVLPKLIDKRTIYYGDVLQIPDNVLYGGKFSKTKICGRNICHQSIFYPISVFEKYSYELKYRIYADWNLNLMCFADKDFTFEYIGEIITLYSMEGLSSISHDDVIFKQDFYKIIKSQFGSSFYYYRILLHFLSKIVRFMSFMVVYLLSCGLLLDFMGQL